MLRLPLLSILIHSHFHFLSLKAKARLQASMPTGTQSKSLVAPFRGPLDALVRTYRYEGFRALYGG